MENRERYLLSSQLTPSHRLSLAEDIISRGDAVIIGATREDTEIAAALLRPTCFVDATGESIPARHEAPLALAGDAPPLVEYVSRGVTSLLPLARERKDAFERLRSAGCTSKRPLLVYLPEHTIVYGLMVLDYYEPEFRVVTVGDYVDDIHRVRMVRLCAALLDYGAAAILTTPEVFEALHDTPELPKGVRVMNVKHHNPFRTETTQDEPQDV